MGVRVGDGSGDVFGVEDREYGGWHGAVNGAGDKVKTGDETGTEMGMRMACGLGWKGIENGVKGEAWVGMETWLCSGMGAGRSRPPVLDSFPADPNYSWEEDRKYILRGWALLFSILATLMVLSALDGRMAYLKGSYTGYMGLWINCRKYTCPNLGQVTGQWGHGRGHGARRRGSLETIRGRDLQGSLGEIFSEPLRKGLWRFSEGLVRGSLGVLFFFFFFNHH